MLGNGRTNRHKTVPAAHPTLKEGRKTEGGRRTDECQPAVTCINQKALTIRHGSQLHKLQFLSALAKAGRQGRKRLFIVSG